MEAPVYSQEGKETGKVILPESLFGLPWNADLVHQVVTSMQTGRRRPYAHTKTRGEVRGGGRKPWRQKGTGRARHGSTRSPLWVGGGVTHGPRNEKNFERKVNRKMKTKALLTILSQKARDGEVVFLDDIKFASPKTREAARFIGALATFKGLGAICGKRQNALYVALPRVPEAVRKSFRNIGKVSVGAVKALSAVEALRYKFLAIASPEVSFKELGDRVC